jgi:uncharacterized protein
VGQPPPYVLNYQLETGDDFVTSNLRVTTEGHLWSRRLDLTRSQDGIWSIDAASVGGPDLPEAGGDADLLTGSLDCDLGLSPMTNTMPVLRHGLHRGGGPIDFLMAWVSVPALSVHPSEQRYTYVGRSGEHSIVRYEGKHPDFVCDLVFDKDGLVVRYPDLASRVAESS